MSGKAWIIFGVICVLLFGGLVVYSGRDKVDVSGVDTNKIQAADENSGNIADHVYGDPDAKVVLIEYGDFQCPGCGGAHPSVKALSEKYQEQMAFVYRNFPLTNIHPNARAAAAAAETAGLQGKYWEMHNLIFESQDQWSSATTEKRTDIFANYAQQIGLDKAAFTTALTERSKDFNRKINFDIALGRKLNVSGTPTFYLNGKKLSEDKYSDAAALEKTLLDAFKEAGVTVPEEAAAPTTE